MTLATEPMVDTAEINRFLSAGWYQIGWSADLGPGDVRPLELGSLNLALYRGQSQLLMLIDAYCPHMGANLGYGGRVVGDDIVCPFHGWRWAPSGSNVEIPYSETPNDRRFTHHWVVREEAGLVLAWYHPNGASPVSETALLVNLPDNTLYRRRDLETSADPRNVREALLDGIHMARVLGFKSVSTSVTAVEQSLIVRHALVSEKDAKMGEELTIELRSPNIASIRSSIRSAVSVVSWLPSATYGVQVRVATYGDSHAENAWLEDYLLSTLPLLEKMQYVDELAPLPSEEPLVVARQWFNRNEA